jgi:sodium/potassium-transporting ATPase subunit alpha
MQTIQESDGNVNGAPPPQSIVKSNNANNNNINNSALSSIVVSTTTTTITTATVPPVKEVEKDVELGGGISEVPISTGLSKSKSGIVAQPFVYEPHLPQPEEPYLPLEEVVRRHADSQISPFNIESSYGLTDTEAARRLEKYGRNVLTPPPRMPEWMRFLLQFKNVFLILLNICALLSLLAFLLNKDIINLYLAVVLAVVVFLTAYMQFHEEGKALQVIDSFAKLLASDCTVIRSGKEKTIPTDQLVPGDIVKIKNGDRCPADILILLSRGLKTECSSLNGESEPIPSSTNPSPRNLGYFECKNVAFSSSLCFDGTAIGVVIRTGDHTGIGTIAKLASDTKMRESTLQKEVANFVKFVAIIALTMATGSFIAAVFIQKAKTFDEILKIFVNGFLVIIVANVPQGLPATVTSLLSLAARNMAQQSVLVKRIDCVETLGSTSIICSDKTGTLTKNEMTVTDVWFNRKLKSRHKRTRDSLYSQAPQPLFYRASVLCNGAARQSAEESQRSTRDLHQKQQSRLRSASALVWRASVSKSILNFNAPEHKFVGNPSDVAIITYADHLVDTEHLRHMYPIQYEVPFNSTNKWQLIIVQSVNNDILEDSRDIEYEVIMKGAPEVILNRCTTYASEGQGTHHHKHTTDVTEDFRTEFNQMYENFASQGRRVIALCSKTFTGPPDMKFSVDENNVYNFPTTDLNFIAMVAIQDPPRDNVPDAIALCRRAGIRVFMVTGDHPLTGRAISEQIGLLDKTKANIELLQNVTTEDSKWGACDGAVIHGSRIDALTDDQWKKILSKRAVCFARTTPAHKLEIVSRCQGMGNIVAVTGDGVNDAPALKQADVGIAMGLNGSDVAQDAADILLMDDNFASIVKGIEEGRLIFDNIKKTIAYTMAHIFPEVVSALINLLAALPAGLTAMQVLTIDLGTELGPAISLAYEKAESDIMDRPPRDPKRDRLVSPSLILYSYLTSGAIISAGCIGAYAMIYYQHDVHMKDFFAPDINSDKGGFFSLSPSGPVKIQRSGKTWSEGEQKRLFSRAATAFYIALTVGQFFHIWMCKTRINSLFTHGFSNKLTFYGVAVGLLLVIVFCYIPGIQDIVGSYFVNWVPWLFAVANGVVLWVYNESVKYYFRHAKPGSGVVRWLSW